MLILSRNKNESIMIGDDVEVIIADIRGDTVKLGITAPTSIIVDRKEIYVAKRAMQKDDKKKGVSNE